MIDLPRPLNRFAPLLRQLAILSLIIALQTGCAGRRQAAEEIGADQLYEQGAEQLRNGNYAGAIISFNGMRVRYPFSPITRQAQLDLIYSYYRSGQPDSALDVAINFIRENPRVPEVDYCLYMIGLIRFDREPNVIERVFRVDVTERPPKESQQAFASFQDLILQFPDSRYAEDSRRRMVYLRNRLAIYENHVARYYLQRGAYVAAINRGKFALEHYSGAPELEETLTLMIEAYETLGMTDLANDSRRVRQENFGSLTQ